VRFPTVSAPASGPFEVFHVRSDSRPVAVRRQRLLRGAPCRAQRGRGGRDARCARLRLARCVHRGRGAGGVPARAAARPPAASFGARRAGASGAQVAELRDALGYGSLDAVAEAVVAEASRLGRPLALAPGRSEASVLAEMREVAAENRVLRSYIGMGYHGCVV